MAKFDPIERLPDGTLFRLTPGQARSVRSLTKRCCNFSQGDCLLLDSICPQAISRSLICRWFRHAVLPEQPKLERAILSPKQLHRCEVCGRGFLTRSGKAKYCRDCAAKVHRKQKAESTRKRRSGVDNIIRAFSSTAKKYGLDFALKKDTSGEIPRYLVFFKGRDADVITAAFREFSAKNLDREKHPSIHERLTQAKERAKHQDLERGEKVKTRDRGLER